MKNDMIWYQDCQISLFLFAGEEKGGGRVQYLVNISPFLPRGGAERGSSSVLLSSQRESSQGKIYEESLERAESYFL